MHAHIAAERFALLNEIDPSEVLDFFRGLALGCDEEDS